ncbi:hypothetical protein ACMU_00530 [Actibacterium mucosum KCTC 23349]|uniref:VOC domain-containing protein n=1 Tax=Actibacterium mucosum KCTC 23349 TaxID=1454373 RepID=A0A037ZMZ2_9RHOB|nr:VOC family protein [Actibacterium mucosum]KAJ57010.1 hypothetical protein ACMU_00530 [Actibacterium mucosum KCTC 23349]
MPDTTMTTPGNAGWIGFSGPDNAKAKAFYADVLGWQINEMPMQDGSSYSGIFVNDAPIGGFSPMPEDSGAWTIFVTVTDVDGATKKAEERGAQILNGPMDMPGVGRMTTIIDPQGARIAMITYESMQG